MKEKIYKIAIIPGDGIGPEVIREGCKVLDVVSKKHSFSLAKTEFDFGGGRYLKTGHILSDDDIKNFKKFQAIYLGGIGHPEVKPGILERGILLKLRFDLDQYINLRPVRLYENVETPIKNKTPQDIDYTVIRENTGDLYTGVGEFKNKGSKEEVAIQSMIYSYKQVERSVRYAFEFCQNRHQSEPWRGLSSLEKSKGYIGKVTMCGKTNVLTYVFDLWQRVFQEIANEFPKILTDYVHVDAMCIYMIEAPERFDTIVTSNMFGDIITDLAAVTQGGMGVAPSGNINPKGVSMFEPVHGTAPQFTGQNVINPIAAIASGAMLLNHLGEKAAAQELEKAMRTVIKQMKSMQVGKMGMTTSQVGDAIVEQLSKN